MDLLDTSFARRDAGPDFITGTRTDLLFEDWSYAWSPQVEGALIEASVHGDSVMAGIVGGGVGSMVALTVVTLGAGATFHAIYQFAYSGQALDVTGLIGAPTDNKGRETFLSGMRGNANIGYTAAGVLAVGTVAAWAAGILEAYISGTDVDSLDDALVTN